MQRILILIALILILASVALNQRRGFRGGPLESLPAANSDAERRVLDVLNQMQRAGSTYLSVPVTDGRTLRLLAEAANAKNIVEIGTSTGFSGLWFCLALETTDGHLTTFEYDRGRAATARAHFQKAGVDRLVTVIEGDAHQTISRLTGPIDLAFIDADKEGYVDYLNKLLPLVRPGGLILAHNVTSADDYVRAVNGNPALETLYRMDGAGLSITLKKRPAL
jgi:predicted O-methyltransferase YrrM